METEESAERISFSLKEADQRQFSEKQSPEKGLLYQILCHDYKQCITVTILHARVLFSEKKNGQLRTLFLVNKQFGFAV